MTDKALHWNAGGPKGWTTACGIESANFVEHRQDRNQVTCQRCVRSLRKDKL
jgi:hypothetical protein